MHKEEKKFTGYYSKKDKKIYVGDLIKYVLFNINTKKTEIIIALVAGHSIMIASYVLQWRDKNQNNTIWLCDLNRISPKEIEHATTLDVILYG